MNFEFQQWGLAWYGLSAFGLMLVATPWIGMWMGLKCKTPARAIMATLALVFVVPRFGACFMIDPFYFLAMWLMARNRVRTDFKSLLAERFAPSTFS